MQGMSGLLLISEKRVGNKEISYRHEIEFPLKSAFSNFCYVTPGELHPKYGIFWHLKKIEIGASLSDRLRFC
jgi:hypothetical protein